MASPNDLDRLADVGVTAIELLPVAQFAGNRGWGYDGVLLFAPHIAYGGPEGLKRLVDAAHARGLMILLDVVYNHFGPEGNYLHLYAPDFFNPKRHTPWGSAIAFERQPVREFFIHNVLYWLNEFHFDGLRFDAIDQIDDPSGEEILAEMAREVRARFPDRHVHLTIEDDDNSTRLLQFDADNRPRLFDAEWNDDWHHAMHALLTHEDTGYYQDYADAPARRVADTMAQGFGYQGEPSPFRGGRKRGQPSAHLPPTAFIDFVQNHDQVGNRAQGDRITTLAEPEAVEAALALLLLSPHIPLLFMGEEYGEERPFQFFTDFKGDLAEAVRKGRNEEFRNNKAFAEAFKQALVPDPNALSTFTTSMLKPETIAPDRIRETSHRHALRACGAEACGDRRPCRQGGGPARQRVRRKLADQGRRQADPRRQSRRHASRAFARAVRRAVLCPSARRGCAPCSRYAAALGGGRLTDCAGVTHAGSARRTG